MADYCMDTFILKSKILYSINQLEEKSKSIQTLCTCMKVHMHEGAQKYKKQLWNNPQSESDQPGRLAPSRNWHSLCQLMKKTFLDKLA